MWDHAPGALIVEEAGGRVTDYAGGRPALDSGKRTFEPAGGGLLVSCGGAVHGELLTALKAAPQLETPHFRVLKRTADYEAGARSKAQAFSPRCLCYAARAAACTPSSMIQPRKMRALSADRVDCQPIPVF